MITNPFLPIDDSRLSFLKSIVRAPQDDTVRLVYADWLDENMPDDPVARATSEFIRVSCRPGGSSTVMPMAAYRWLEINWSRLVPSLMALHEPWAESRFSIPVQGRAPFPVPPGRGPAVLHAGRNVGLRMNLRPTALTGRRRVPRPTTVRLEFWKGFLINDLPVCTRDGYVYSTACAVAQDQPHTRLVTARSYIAVLYDSAESNVNFGPFHERIYIPIQTIAPSGSNIANEFHFRTGVDAKWIRLMIPDIFDEELVHATATTK